MTPLPLDIHIFEWFDHNGWAYWLIAWSIVALWLGSALAPLGAPSAAEAKPRSGQHPRSLRLLGSPVFFVAVTLLVFCAFRWPLWFAGPLENPDEAEWIAGALTLRDGGLPWKSIDCHTSGPLNAATLLLTIPLGLPLDYVGVRVLTSLLQAASVLALWGAGRRLLPEWIARLAVLPAVNFWACRWFHDIGQYSSEQTSVLLLALAGWGGAVALTTGRPKLKLLLLALAGALTTTAPLVAKPQAAPIAGVLGLILLYAAVRPAASAGTADSRLSRTMALAAGALAPFLLLASYLWLYGLLNQVRIFYWQSNVLYTNESTFSVGDTVRNFNAILAPIEGGAAAIYGALGFAALALLPALRCAPDRRARLLGAWLLVAAAILCILAPGRVERRHYLHFLVIPLAWLAAVSLEGSYEALARVMANPRRRAAALAAVFVAISSTAAAWRTTGQCPPMNGQLFFWRERQGSIVGDVLRGLANQGDKLVVWGWSPRYHAESGLAQGSREAHCGLIIGPGPLQSHYRDRLLFDLKRNQPRWFVDAVAPSQFGFEDRQRFGHESWPTLGDYIAERYDLVDEVDGVRTYRRKDEETALPPR